MAITAPTLEKHIQVISAELMDALKASASEHGISLDMEVAIRLMAFLSRPELTQDNTLSQQILRKKFTAKEAFDECKRKHEAEKYLYEIEKLSLLLGFEGLLPENFKETFEIIDVKEARKQIKNGSKPKNE